jgi:D-alanyl-D-alanine carboxypeptidase/D-alanyl-D-alanine carboxypeptidase (penicillin-binding protein 5/6)
MDKTSYEVSYDLTEKERAASPTAVAKVLYTFNSAPIGEALICYSPRPVNSHPETEVATGTIYINVKHIIALIGLIILFITLLNIIFSHIHMNRTHVKRSDRIRYNRRKKEVSKLKFKKNKF